MMKVGAIIYIPHRKSPLKGKYELREVYKKEEFKMTIMYISNAERAYFERNPKAKKQRENMEERQYRLVQLYNKVFNAIGNMKSNKDYIPVRNLLNAFSHECGADSMSVFRLYKELEAKIQELLAENDTNLQKKQKEIEDVKNITITEPLEKLQQLELESNQILYSYMSQLHANGMQENTDRRRIGQWAKNATRAEAMALQKLMALPQYANYFKENQKKVIFENAQNPDLIKHKKMVQPVIEKKQAELGNLYMEGFQLRNIQKRFSADLKALQKDGDE